ncbi:MAG: dTDP-4-dehydrorhamnose 3,5-epimerase [Cellulophaga sp.]|uniref:dTDP-4-dehydrorhamnose 3,5-epimerase n=1 Tax=unclassified Cellulophaga TaxID=2634405 RepID=UPI0026E2EFF2|nr:MULTISPECIES: dTDP-4-dehydrorhamnose 3,5-epimerase [unclassified Cellulophaga]MDO6489748.1 dTDP-4-dehydrorhamnose 3,5-epimerase [Cellulophaga sp. 2_MG-2023]MDO6495058.1 dTDP-4-dehydrorhamnose 3,5-epimerase [Cellulophaga sp. 3_MG-2023]
MEVKNTGLEGCLILEPILFNDSRGYFFERYNNNRFNKVLGQKVNFVQDNQSFSLRGVVRGLHFQKGNFAQAKLIYVLKGVILDVVVDLRPHSKTYGEYFSVELSSENKKQLFVPKGFAHGFSVLSDTAEVLYKCDSYYNKESEGGIIYNDATLNIDWKVSPEEIKVSEKDLTLPTLKELLV